MTAKKLLLASSIAFALTITGIGNTSIEIQEEQKWIKSQFTSANNGNDRVAFYIKYASGNKAQIKESLLTAGAKIDYELNDYDTFAISLAETDSDTIKNIPHVIFYEPVPEYQLQAQTTPWNIDQFQARDVWDKNRDGIIDVGAPTGAGVKFCIIDSGFYAAHDEFQGITHNGISQIPGELYTEDGNGHGTHVAGTANAMNNDIGVVGVMPGGAEFFIVKIFDNTGTWSTGNSNLGNAITTCKDNGANAISMSLGGPSSFTEEAIFQDLYDNFNIISIAAAGNDGDDASSYPASYDSVISVAAVRESDNVADFSQHPATGYNPSSPPANVEWDVVELSGGGESVLSTWPTPDGDVPVYQVTNDGADYSANHLAETGLGDVTANLADGGLCDSVGSWSGNIVLCARGDIDFSAKMNNVFSGGGIGVVISNNVAGSLNGTCAGNCTSPGGADIPGVSISQTEGQFLLANGLGLPTRVLADDGSGCVGCSGGYNTISGTSMATPGVAAGIAWAWSACGGPTGITNKELRQLLRDSARDLSGTHDASGTSYGAGWDPHTGFGLVQLSDALILGNTRFGSTCPIALSSTPKIIDTCTIPTTTDAVFNLTVDPSFAGTSDLSVTGVPVTASSSFSVNPVISPADASVFTVSNLDGIAFGSHAISFTATDSGDPGNTVVSAVTLNTFSATPATFSLSSPSDASSGVSTKPSLSWAASTEAASYTLEVATDLLFANIVVNETGLTTPFYTIPTALASSAEYFWRVTAINPCGTEVSSVSSFTTVNHICFTPSTAIPDDDPVGVTNTETVALSGSLSDLDVIVKLNHTYVGDLVISLTNVSSGISVDLMDRPSCSGSDIDATFDDNASIAVEGQCDNSPAIHGFVIPQQSLASFNTAELFGDWSIKVSDNAGIDTGVLEEWCLVPTFATATAVPDSPTAINEDSGVNTIDVLDNDSDSEGSPFIITKKTDGSNGIVAITNAGVDLTYTPNADFCGADSFTYSITGGSTATVTMDVTCINDQPAFIADTTVYISLADSANPLAENVACNFNLGPGTENSTQVVSAFNVTIDSDSSGILTSVEILNDGSLSAAYTGTTGTASLSVTLQDNGGTDLGGIDSSVVHQIDIHVADYIFKGGFEIETCL